jgi:hypothetical protein
MGRSAHPKQVIDIVLLLVAARAFKSMQVEYARLALLADKNQVTLHSGV